MGSKRKHHPPARKSRDRILDEFDPISSNTKRRRLSSEEGDSNDQNLFDSHGQVTKGEPHDDGWTVVSSKGMKKRSHYAGLTQRSGDYPALRTYQNYQSDIRLKDIRDLGLYVLADEVAPRWTAVANAKNVVKVVTIMVPGLDTDLLRQAQESLQSQHSNSNNISDAQIDTAISKEEQYEANSNLQTSTTPTQDSQAEPHTSEHDWLFDHVIPVIGPGDTKMNKVHSPLQAMLLAPESENKRNRGQLSMNMPSTEKVPISELIHNADELREAEYPIHPAAFTSRADSEVEATRRERTGQGAQDGWVDSNVQTSTAQVDSHSRDWLSQGLSVYSLDCEMVQTSDEAYSLARISLIAYPDGKVIIDKYVKPDLPVTNYHTQYSGITPKILENVSTTLRDIQQELLTLLTPSAVLLGHSLDSDLNALKLTHPFVIDTSIIFPHPRGLPLRSSLKFLANKYLKREIQTAGANGHNSVEDARAVLDLVKLKCEKGIKYGTLEANGEPIFRRLKRAGKSTTMVEYGTPERGYGKDATHTIGCQDDQEVTNGVIRGIKGDDYFDFEIPSGGSDYVWGRLRALEFARGWVSGATSLTRRASQEPQDSNAPTEPADGTQSSPVEIALETVHRLRQIYDALPDRALLTVFSGTGDVRPVMKLQAQQQQYRKEFKVKKWDELTVKWTDTEEQALRKACDNARAGWAVCIIK